jgi:2-keto-4-pentenoate hydratase/2-oxohepta-3-ene-1,7-dioic acid hydratase in catechol pathway
MWYKPRRALGKPGNISVPAVAAAGFLDFEASDNEKRHSKAIFNFFFKGELTIVTSKDARDVSVKDAPDYILGYTVGNDLTARMFQDPKRCGGQFTRCKAFDGFAPLGPVLTSTKAFGEVQNARITVKVNGKVFQDSPCDLIHTPPHLISFLSQGKS